MAGFREFAAGEPLTSANVDDFLAKQAVMKFADAAARDAALGTTVVAPNALREGMIAYLDDDNEVQYFDGTAWEPVSEPPAGIGSNVVSVSKTDVFTTSSASFVDVTGLTATITPSSATAKILIDWSVLIGNTNAASLGRGVITDGSNTILIEGDTRGLRTNATFGSRQIASTDTIVCFSGMFLFAPASTSAQTIKIRVSTSGGTMTVNRSGLDSNDAFAPSPVSSITVIEVAA